MPLGRLAAYAATALLLVISGASCSTTANVTDVYMSLDGDGTRRRNEFFTDSKEIHCIGEAGVGRPGVTAEGFVRQLQAYDFATNKYEPVDRIVAYGETALARSPNGLVRLDLSLKPGTATEQAAGSNEAPFVAGRYQCEVLLDGELEGTAIFNIEFPPCPPAIIVPFSRCFGYYRENDLCPANGATAAQEPKCSCTLGGWQC